MNLFFCVVSAWAPLVFVSAAVLVPGGASLPTGSAPRFFTVTAIHDDSCELQEVGETQHGLIAVSTYRPELRHLDIVEAGGKNILAKEFAQRVKVGTMVVVARDHQKVDPAYRAVLKPDTLVLHGVVVREEAAPARPEPAN